MSRDVYSVFPRGWFVIAFAEDVAVGEVKPIRYFGRDMVLYRGEDGVARVLDAHCPHLGAHMGHGGKVVGNSLRCPFHAWRFCGTGACVEIPYAKKIPPGARVNAWPVREANGVIYLHHDPEGRPPEFDVRVIEEHGTEGWLPWSRNAYHIETHPREIVENLADRAHFPAVHRTEIDEFVFEIEGHVARQRVKGRSFLHNGGVDSFSSVTEYHGPGYLVMRMDGVMQNYMLVAHTPVDHGSVDLRMGVMLKVQGSRAKTERLVGLYMDNLKHGFEDDIAVWEHKVWREQPALCDGDGPIGRLRKWYRQFYLPSVDAPANEPVGEVMR